MVDRSFPRERRVLRRLEFDAVFGEGRSRADGLLIVYARPRPEGGPSRLGLVVGRRFGKAVRRNAWKRMIREAFRQGREDYPEGHDYVVLPREPETVPELAAARRSLRRLTRDAVRIYGKRGPKT